MNQRIDPLMRRSNGNVSGHPKVLVQGPPARNGWIRWAGEEGDEFQRVLWLLWDGDRSKLTTQAGEKVRCYRCGATESPRWAVAYRVAELGARIPLRGHENELICKGCAMPKSDTAEFIEEEA